MAPYATLGADIASVALSLNNHRITQTSIDACTERRFVLPNRISPPTGNRYPNYHAIAAAWLEVPAPHRNDAGAGPRRSIATTLNAPRMATERQALTKAGKMLVRRLFRTGHSAKVARTAEQ